MKNIRRNLTKEVESHKLNELLGLVTLALILGMLYGI